MATDVESTKAKKQKPEQAAPPSKQPPEEFDLNNLDKIRHILFGAQAREYERQFARLEETVAREMEALRHTFHDRLGALEAYVKAENEALSKRLKAEQDRRAQLIQEVREELRGTEKALKAEQTRLEEQLSEAERALRERMLEQSKDLSAALQDKADALSTSVEKMVGDVREQKTDRQALADLFSELSLRLRGDFHLVEET